MGISLITPFPHHSPFLIDLYKNEVGNFVPELQPQGSEKPAPEIELKGRPFEPMTADEEEKFFMGKTTILDNAKTIHIKDCYIDPREMEVGIWPNHFSCSDHGFLTCRYELESTV